MVLDTNIVILLSKGDVHVRDFLVGLDERLFISRITYIEFLSDKKMTDVQRSQSRDFLNESFAIVDVDESVGDEAVNFRQETSLKMPDAIIAATAVALGHKLVSFDAVLRKALPRIVVTL